jgi:hypothetical protein
MPLAQPTENKGRRSGTRLNRQPVSNEDLLQYEYLWFDTLLGLRDGVSVAEIETVGSSGFFAIGTNQEGREILLNARARQATPSRAQAEARDNARRGTALETADARGA